MTSDEFKKMLNMVYELEGLLELALRRGGDMPANLAALVADKSFMIANRAAGWKVDAATLEEVEVVTYASDAPAKTSGEDKETSVGPKADRPEELQEKEVEIFVNEVLPESEPEPDENQFSEESEVEPVGEAEEPDAESASEADEPEMLQEPEDEPEAEIDEVEENTEEDSEDIADEVAQEEKPAAEDKSSVEQVAAHSGKPLASFFSINDKFRFRRELFSNSNAEFVDALNLIETMESMAEAEDYFFNDLQWDSESDDVADFLTIVRRYFSSSY